MPTLAILSPVLPSPPLVGGTAHIVGAARQLAKFYKLDFYGLVADVATPASQSLAQHCDRIVTFPRVRPGRWGISPPAVRQEHSAAMLAHLRRAWAQRPPDIVQIEFTTMAQYAPLACEAGALAVCTAHNVAFLAQIRRALRERDLAARLRRWIGALSLWRYELLALRQCHLVVALGQADQAALRRWLPGLPVVYVPSGVNLDERSVCFDPRAEDEALFVGSYSHPPNVEGARWLAREVWPLVRRSHPTARLTLAGRAPPPEIRELSAPDIHVPGTVDDLQPYYARASVMTAPVFWGSGVRIKILDALAHGLPLVTTSAAAEGIDLEHGRSALFAERPDQFAAAIVRLLEDQTLRSRLGAAGRALIERDYDWARNGRRLVGLYEGARAGLNERGSWTIDC